MSPAARSMNHESRSARPIAIREVSSVIELPEFPTSQFFFQFTSALKPSTGGCISSFSVPIGSSLLHCGWTMLGMKPELDDRGV